MHLVTVLAAMACAAAPIDRTFLKELVAIPSESAKTERVNEAMAFTRAYLEKRGVPCATERDGQRDILYASTRPGKVQDYLLCVHLDVVPAPDAKMYEPRIEGDRLFGRGACDDKGNAAVAVQTLVDLLGKASMGVIFTADAEIGGLTTLTMVRLGKVYHNLMVDMRPTNQKLKDRAVRIVQKALEIPDKADAAKALEDAGGDVKTAIVMRSCAVNRQEAQAALNQADGFVRRAQDSLKTRRAGKF